MISRSSAMHPVALISARIDAETSPGEIKFLEAHLRACADCQRLDGELRATAATLRGLIAEGPPSGAVERLLSHVRESTALTAPSPVVAPPRSQGGSRGARAWIAVVTMLPILALVSWMKLRPEAVSPAKPVAPDASMAPSAVLTLPAESALVPEPAPAPVSTPVPAAAPPAPESAKPKRRARVPPPVVEPPPRAMEPLAVEASREELPPPVATGLEPGPRALPLAAVSFKGNGKRLGRDARQQLEEIAERMRRNPEARLVISAHTDERRTLGKTLDIGQKRALAIAERLEELGIDPARLRIESAVDGSAAAAGGDDERRDRVELLLEP